VAHESDHPVVDPRAEPTAPSPARGQDWRDPISGEIHAWLNDFVKAAKAHRVYAENNEMLVRFVDRAHQGLQAILHKVPELSLSVREDRLLYGKDPVHINNNREEGLPFVLYRNAFRRITLVAGFERDEVTKLMRALVTDYSNFDYAGEDLVTTLWRLALPHLRYLTIDALSSSVVGHRSVEERADIDRIQGSIEDIVAAIYQTNATDEDIVAGVSITKEDLEALKDVRLESQEDLDLLDQETSRTIAMVAPEELRNVQAYLAADTRDALVRRLMDVLVRILFKEQSARESALTIDLLSQLFDSMVVGHRFLHATELISRLRHYAEHSQSMQELHIARHLLRMFASESRVAPVLGALNEGYKSTNLNELIGFLRALGPGITPHLVGALDNLVAPAHRRLICDLIVELGVPDVPVLMEKASTAKWFVFRDVLGLAQHFPSARIAGLILAALRHEHPKVRAQAVGMLRSYARGTADKLLVECFVDADLEVRMTAYRVAAMRKSFDARAAFERIFREEDLSTREPKELRSMTASYAAIAGVEAVPALDALLNPGILASFKDPEPQIAAAMALGSLSTDAAEAALSRGSRTLNPRVREAVKRAQARHEGTDDLEHRRQAKAELIDLPTPEPEEPSGYTIHPALRPEGHSPTPLPNLNAADVSFSARTGGSGDHLANAPDFRVPTADLEVPAALSESPLLRPRPVMPHAARLEGAFDTMPSRMPPGVPEVPSLFGPDKTAPIPVPPAISPRVPATTSDLLRSSPTSPIPSAPNFEPPRAAPPPPVVMGRPAVPSTASDLLRSAPSAGIRETMPGRPLPAPATPAPPPPSPTPNLAADLLRGPSPVGAREVMPPPPAVNVSDLLRAPPTVGAREVMPGRPMAPPPRPPPAPTADLGRGTGSLPPRVTGPVFPFADEPTAHEFDDESDEPTVNAQRASAELPRAVAPAPPAPIPRPTPLGFDAEPTPPARAWTPPAALQQPSAPHPPAAPPRAPAPVVPPSPAPQAAPPSLAALEDDFAEYLRSFDDPPPGKK
jgi:hypothetical protein